MSKVLIPLVFMLALNVVFFISQESINNIAIGEAPQYFNKNDMFIGSYDQGDYTIKNYDPNDLPDTEAGVSEEGNLFTDIWNTMKSWITDSKGYVYAKSIVNAVPNFLKQIGLPVEISFALGFFWHAMTVFLLILFVRGD